jgi:deoxyribodipyrimidine photolyase
LFRNETFLIFVNNFTDQTTIMRQQILKNAIMERAFLKTHLTNLQHLLSEDEINLFLDKISLLTKLIEELEKQK